MILLVIASCLNCQGGSSNILENRLARMLRGMVRPIARVAILKRNHERKLVGTPSKLGAT